MLNGKNGAAIRVLQVVTCMDRAGLETFLMNLYRNLDRERVQFDFLVHRPHEADYEEEIRALGGRIFRVPRQNPLSSSYKKALNDFFFSHPEYRIVHAHLDCLSALPLSAAKAAGIPVRIAHSHNSNQDKDLKLPLKLIWKKKIPSAATHLFACGEEAGKWMFGGAAFQVVRNGIDVNAFCYNETVRQECRRELGISDDTFVMGHVGRFEAAKNHTFLLDIFQEFRKKNPKSTLLLVGDGSLRSEVEQKAEAEGLKDKVIFTGVRSDTSRLYQAMDCFVMPSRYEGLPVVLVEAQAADLPCVISEGVPKESIFTERSARIPLSSGAQIWSETIEKLGKGERKDQTARLKAAGYDAKENAREMQKFYESVYQE